MMSNLQKHLMSSRESKKLVENYDNSNYQEINRGRPTDKPDSKSYSIDLEVLQEYLKMISAEMDKIGVSKKGVRINLGKYPSKSEDSRLDPDYQGYQMVFISPADLDQKAHKNMVSTDEQSASRGLEDIPNLNYMNISPPN